MGQAGIDDDDLVVRRREIAVEPDFDTSTRELREDILRYGARLLAIGENGDCNAATPGIDQRLRDLPVRKGIRVHEDFRLRTIDRGDDQIVDGVAGRERDLDRARRRVAAWSRRVRVRGRCHGERQRDHKRSCGGAAAVHRLRSSTAAKNPSQP